MNKHFFMNSKFE